MIILSIVSYLPKLAGTGLEVEIFEGCFRNLTCSCFCDRQS